MTDFKCRPIYEVRIFSVSDNGENGLRDEGADGAMSPSRISGLEPPLIYCNDFWVLTFLARDDSSADNSATSYPDHHVLRHDSDTQCRHFSNLFSKETVQSAIQWIFGVANANSFLLLASQQKV